MPAARFETRLLSRGWWVLLLLGLACGRSGLRPIIVVVNHASPASPPPAAVLERAAVDDEIAELPGAMAWWATRPGSADRIYVLEVGPKNATATPLVLVHGLGPAGIRDFYPVLRELAASRRVILFDLPGLGRSTARAEPTLDAFTAAIDMVVAARGKSRSYDLLGHSLGGAVALVHAARRADRVRRLVLVDVAGVLHREAFVDSQVGSKLSPLGRVSRRLEDYLSDLARKLVDADGLMGEDKIAWLGGPQAKAAMALIAFNMGPYFAGVKAPTLLLWGSRDTVAPLRTAWLLEDRIAAASLEVLDGVGHVPMAESPKRFVRAVRCHFGEIACAPPVATPPATSTDVVECEGETDRVYRGTYRRLSLRNCNRVVLDGATVEILEIFHSQVRLKNTRVHRGINARRSVVEITGGEISGDVALLLDGTAADLAGVKLRGVRAAVWTRRRSHVLFSATLVESPYTNGAVHALINLGSWQRSDPVGDRLGRPSRAR